MNAASGSSSFSFRVGKWQKNVFRHLSLLLGKGHRAFELRFIQGCHHLYFATLRYLHSAAQSITGEPMENRGFWLNVSCRSKPGSSLHLQQIAAHRPHRAVLHVNGQQQEEEKN
jgi:hypothetical protein